VNDTAFCTVHAICKVNAFVNHLLVLHTGIATLKDRKDIHEKIHESRNEKWKE
jgi:hypothetical protein